MDDIETLLEILGEMPDVLYCELKHVPPLWTCCARVQEAPPLFERQTKECPIEALTGVLLKVAPYSISK